MEEIMVILDDGKNYLDMGGVWVQDDALKVAQAVHDYDENLQVICLDPDRPGVTITSAPFMVIQRMSNGTYQKVLEAWELDDRVLQRIWAADQQKNNQLDTLEKWEKAIKDGQDKRYREALDQANELSIDILASKASAYSFKNKEGDKIKLREDTPYPTVNDAKKSFS
jgi:hypothetical protein